MRNRALFCLIAFIAAGCSTLPLDSRRIPHPRSRSERQIVPEYREVVGVIHVHTTYSDDALGTLEEVARTANAQELDFLVITDHDTLQGRRDGKAGWHGETLVLIDEEISAEGGHYLALNVGQEVPRKKAEGWTVEEVARRGGLGFIAHPYWKRKPWKDLEVRGVTGLEIYSGAQDLTEQNLLWLGFWTVTAGSDLTLIKWIDRQDQSMELWDRLLARGGRVVGIGSPDAHGLRRWGIRLAPYSTMFKLVRNHLLVPELTPEAVYGALEQGRLFVAHDLVADARGFSFTAVSGDKAVGVMGDRLRWQEGLRAYAYLPTEGVMFLFKDGEPAGTARGQHGWFRLPGPGVYRLEATRDGKPWIYSNPLYVVE